MKKFLLNFLFLTSILFTGKVGFAQTIINYETWTGASGCNIFASSTNVPVTVNGNNATIAHLTAIGQPTYDNVNKSVNIDCRINGSQNEGTEYRITSTFKQGYSYVITITAARIMSQQTGPNVLLRLDMNNGGSGNNTTCNGTGVIDANGSGGLKQSLQIGSNSFSDYVFNYSALSAQQPYLMVAAIPPAGSVLQTILIRKITITESAPAPSFTLTPAAVSVICGSTTTQTFTVNNVNNSPGTLSYNWNLGTSNGWLYNGTAAPASFSTTTNSITLTAANPITLPSNVTVTPVLNGVNQPLLTSTLSFAPLPLYVVNGDNSVCATSNNYYVPTLPAGATVQWQAIPNNIVTINSPNATQTTITAGYNSGIITLIATITNQCGQVGQAYKYDISIGSGVSSLVVCHPIQHPTHLQTSMTLPTRPHAIFSTLQGAQNPDTKPTLQRAKNANAQPTHPG